MEMPHSTPPSDVGRQHATVPVPRDFIPSKGTPTPQVLWVGCSDSLSTEPDALDLLPEETFIHRNLGNILSNGDLSSASAIEWALNLLKVEHIIICGHYGCALLSNRNADELGGWHKHMTELCIKCQQASSTRDQTNDPVRACTTEELHVLSEMNWLKSQPIVKQAMEERGVQVHGFVYDKTSGSCVRLVES